MAACQRKRRLSSNNIVNCSSPELHKIKKKSLASLQFGLPMKPHISLELDSSKKIVVAKKEQIGLSRRQLKPYSNCDPIHHNTLEDVISLPKEIFALEILETVFSYEVWRSYLNEDEREHLSQFLPKQFDTDEVVQSLFSGRNFSFGNPAHKWFTLLASGNLHPDIIIRRDHSLLASQKAYCLELQDYHTGMCGNLLQLKGLWEGCRDPMEFVQIIGRTNNNFVKSTYAPSNEYTPQYSDLNLGGSPESLLAMEDEKACSSDGQAVITERNGEIHKSRGLKEEKTRGSTLDISDNRNNLARSIKGEKVSNCNNLFDGTKYMACIKITKNQLELLKSMKQPGKGIQSKSVKHVLGSLDSYLVQPYAVFEEEEKMKLHNQWLLVVNTVLHAPAYWMVRRAQKEHIVQLLCQDIKENTKQVLQDEEPTDCTRKYRKCFDGTGPVLNMEDDEDNTAAFAGMQDALLHETVVAGGFQGISVDMMGSVENHVIQKMDLITSSHEDMLDASENNAYSNEIQASFMNSPPAFPCISNSSYVSVSREDTQSAARGFWQTSKVSALADEVTSDVGELSCNLEYEPQFLNSETLLHENSIELCTEPILTHRQISQGTFSAYQNEDCNGMLLQSIFSNPELSSYKPQQKQALPHFQQTDVMMGNVQLPNQYQESLHQLYPFESRQKGDEQYYMNQNLPNHMHGISRVSPDLSTSLREQMPPFHLQDWQANSVSVPVPLQPPAGKIFNQNWYSSSQPIHRGWSNPPTEVSVPNQFIGNEASNNDESLFGVLSRCNELRSATPYDHFMGSAGQVTMVPGGFGVTGRNALRNSNILQITNPIEFLSGREPAPSLVHNSIGWVNVPQQNSGLHDPMCKPFLRSWNQ